MPKNARTPSKATRSIPYKRGFRPPSEEQRINALGWISSESLPLQYKPAEDFFPSIPKCVSRDDWLAQFNEKGQTYDDFLKFCPWFPGRRKKSTTSTLLELHPDKVVYIVPVGNFDDECSPPFTELMDYAQKFLGVPVRALNPIGVEVNNKLVYWKIDSVGKELKIRMKCRYDVKSGCYQLCIDDALRQLKLLKPKSSYCLIALTLCDLYEAASDLFVAGMASGQNYVAIFSLFRYDPNKTFSTEFWHDMKQTKRYKRETRKQMILQRSCRLLVHEICHLLGIDHCIFYACCMNGSGHLDEDFSQPMFLCPVDLRKLQTLVGFDIVERYSSLRSFFTKHSMHNEASWTERRIAHITEKV